jgi:two-component system, cell cycle sensor histidine kinase and response regulator CckA
MLKLKANLLIALFLILIGSSAFAKETIVTVGVFQNRPIVYIDDNGKPQGVFVEIIEEIARKENWRIEYVEGSWAECLKRVRNGEINLIASIMHLVRRETFIDFPKESVLNMWGTVITRKKAGISRIFDLEGKVVGVMKDGANGKHFSELIEKFGLSCEIRSFATFREVADAVAEGQVVAGIVNSLSTADLVQKKDNLMQTQIVFNPTSLKFGTAKGTNGQLLSAIDAHLLETKKNPDSSYYKIIRKYYGMAGGHGIPAWIYWGFFLLSALICLLFLFNRVLNHRVRTKTGELRIEINEHKKSEEALRESEENFRILYNNSPDMYVSVSPHDANILLCNETFLNKTGYSREEIIGSPVFKIYHDDCITEAKMAFQEFVETGVIKNQKLTLKRKDGSKIDVSLNANAIRNEAGEIKYSISSWRDITDGKKAEEEKRRLEDQLQKAQKMEAMGLMAGGVAHDLNNILSGIVSYPELLLLDLPEDSPLRKPIKTIQESGMRAADVVEDLLTIARGVATGNEVLNLNTIVEEYINSAEHQKLEKVHPMNTFKTELDFGLLNITGSASHVKKILMNLITNASEAIESKGTVTVSTMNRYLDEPLKGYEDVHTGEYVMLAVSDNGSGISPQDLDRIFEPFYTKKVMGRSGTGLGLAVVWNCMQDHDGYINVKSSEKGTVFEL